MQYALSEQQRERVVLQTAKYIQQAAQIFNKKIPAIAVKFDLKGHTIGMYKVVRLDAVIRYNEAVFAKYFADNLANTVPHEVAHYVVDTLYPRAKTKPHGTHWQHVMQHFGAKPSRLASYDLSGIPKRAYQTRAYRCDCREHALGLRRHNKVVKNNVRYSCRHCKSVLRAC